MFGQITRNASTSNPTFSGENFSKNLVTDLAPLLALFGEQVTTQCLSLSLGWADNILIAVGLLGIMTILVSAIRVSGLKQLKALIGRAREARATTEAELLSSTSEEVCEMWNGYDIVRTYGVLETTQIVLTYNEGSLQVHDLRPAYLRLYIIDSLCQSTEVVGTCGCYRPNTRTGRTCSRQLFKRR